MDLIKALGLVNQIEKTSFLKIIDSFCSDSRKMKPKVDEILNGSVGTSQLKNFDNEIIVRLFSLLKEEYKSHLVDRIQFSDFQLDIIVEIFVRDGNQIMSREWFLQLYKKALSNLKNKIEALDVAFESEKFDDPDRFRDYKIYRECVRTAYENDSRQNRENHLSWEEKTVLQTLANELDLSNEEDRTITYSILDPKKYEIDDLISELKDSGIILFSRKTNTIFIPNEIVWLLRDILDIEVSTKYMRRVLRHLKDPEINLVARRHGVDRKLSRSDKIDVILSMGLKFNKLLEEGIHKDGTLKSDKAKRILELIQSDLEIELPKMGRTLEERIELLVQQFHDIENHVVDALSKAGYSKLLLHLKEHMPATSQRVKEEFEIQNEDVLCSEFLADYNIGPRDVVYLLTKEELVHFCKQLEIKSRGNLISNILSHYRNVNDLYLENYELIGHRDLNSLKERGLAVKESELGSLFETVTKDVFKKLGFDVNEKLRQSINTSRAQMDILLDLGNKDVLIIECKSTKDEDYNKYTAVSRQLKSYESLCTKNGYRVSRVLVVSNDFSEDFISECEYDYELDLTLVTSKGLLTILGGLNESTMDTLPIRLISKDGVLNANRIVKVLNR
jgi:hypothetical protein